MKKFKKIIGMLLLCSMILGQYCNSYAAEIISETPQSTPLFGSDYFAEKNHILYYFKYAEMEEKNYLQLYQYDLQTETETLLSEDYFKNIFGIMQHLRVCNDGYVYFYGQKRNDDRVGYYRVSIDSGKSEYFEDDTKITFLSDNWMYDNERDILYNFSTKETIKNTIQDFYKITSYYSYYIDFMEYQNVLYICIHVPFPLPDDEKDVNIINGQQLENGVYAVSLYQQDDFHKIEIEEDVEDIYLYCGYNNHLYYQKNHENETQIKSYSLENGTTKIIVSKKEGALNLANICNDTLYYIYFIEKNGKKYSNAYSISLKEGENQPSLTVPYLFGYNVKALEDVVFYAVDVGRFYIGNWRIFNIHTGKRYFIYPY